MITSIIIVNHNTKYFLKDCIDSIYKFESPDRFEIIIVDNASKDDSISVIENIKQKYKNIQPIYLNELKSFSYANNRGIELSQGKYILILNPDIIFESPILYKFTSYLENNEDVGAVSPALFFPNGEFQSYYYQRYPTIKQYILFYSPLGRLFKKFDYFINKYVIESNIKENEKKIFFVEHIPGAFFFTKKDILLQIGLFDENFMLFYEDVDLSYRIHKHYKIAVDTSLEVKHYGRSSTKGLEGRLHGVFYISMIYFFKKHYSKIRYYSLKNIIIIISYFVLVTYKSLCFLGIKNNLMIDKYSNFLRLIKRF